MAELKEKEPFLRDSNSNINNPSEETFFSSISKKIQGMVVKKKPHIEPLEDRSKENRIDEDDNTAYCDDVYSFYCDNQKKFRIPLDFLLYQPEVDERIRTILMDWLVDYHNRCKFKQESLFLAVLLVDRYLSREAVDKKDLQLIAVAALRVACKYNELNPIRGVTSASFTKEDLIDMENKFLQMSEFNVAKYVTPIPFLKRCNIKDEALLEMTNFILENSLLVSQTSTYLPSEIAENSVWLACKILQKPFPDVFINFQVDLKCATFLLKVVQGRKYPTLERKYPTVPLKKIDKYNL